MASWKKVIVSGSQADLAGITGSLLTDDRLLGARDGGAIYSTGVEINGNGHLVGVFSGSASGSFEGDGSGLTGVVAQIENNLIDGNGIADFTFDGSTEVSVAVETSGSTLTVGADGVAIAAGGVTNVEMAANSVDSDQYVDGSIEFIHLDGAAVVTGAEGITNANTGSDDNLATTKAIKDYVDAQVGGATLNISSSNDSTAVAVDLNDEILSVTGNDGLTFNLAGNDVGIGITTGGINAVKLNSDVAGSGLTSTDGVLSLTDDSITIGNETVSLGGTLATVSGLTASGSFSGSFEGDGSGLTGLASTLNIGVKENAADSTTEDVAIDLLADTLVIQGVANEISASSAGDVITIGLPDDVTIGRDLTITRNLVVNGDMTTLNTTNLNIEDKFILLNSGSDGTDVDTGIIFGGTDGVAQNGKAVYYDGGDDKFGFSTAIDSDATTGALSQYIGAIELATADPVNGTVGVQGAGTIHVNTSTEDIFIYV